ILTGSLDDGTAGMLAIKRAGGMTIVQDPNDASYPSMPQSVLENVEADLIAPLSEIPAALDRCLRTPVTSRAMPAGLETMALEKKIAEMDDWAMAAEDRPGQPSRF